MTQRHILLMWLPLALSAMLMTGEILLVQAAVSRLTDAKLMLAALGIMFWLEVLIEAPLIMLLSTSTALTTSAQAYGVLKRFMVHLNLGVSAVAVSIAFIDPLFDLVLRVGMGIPDIVAEPTQTGMKIMGLWPAAIGWRRFNQGILIRYGQPRQVTLGTLVRLLTSALVACSLVISGAFSGIVVAAMTFMSGVTAEALFAWWKSRAIVERHLRVDTEAPEHPLTYRAAVDFHLPLAATSVLSYVALPLVNAGLSRMASPQETLAAWPVVYTLILMFRGPGIAIPETVIALLRRFDDLASLRRFCLIVTMGSTALLAVVIVTPLVKLYVRHVVEAPRELEPMIMVGLLGCLLIPGLAALSNFYRGILMASRATNFVYWGMAIYVGATGVGILVGVIWQTPGIVTAAVAISVATVLETGYLQRRSAAVRAIKWPAERESS